MSFINVHIYKDDATFGNIGGSIITEAANQIEKIEDSVNFSVRTWERDDVNIDLDYGSNYRDLQSNWKSWLLDNAYITNRDYHLLIVDSLSTPIGAGYTNGTIGPEGIGGVFTDGYGEGKTAYGFVNAACAKSGTAYGWQYVFGPTCIHETLHAMIHDDMDKPVDNNDHSMGEIINTGLWNDDVTPIQLWYTSDWTSGNPPPEENCNGRAEVSCEGVRSELSSCVKGQIEDYINSIPDQDYRD